MRLESFLGAHPPSEDRLVVDACLVQNSFFGSIVVRLQDQRDIKLVAAVKIVLFSLLLKQAGHGVVENNF